MRADNNWEDSVGKRLFDYEGELSPQAWKNINKQIQPRRKNRWFIWLPLVLLFIGTPVAFYFYQQSDLTSSENKKGAQEVLTKNGIEIQKKAETKEETNSGEKLAENSNNSSENTEGSDSEKQDLNNALPSTNSTTARSEDVLAVGEKPTIKSSKPKGQVFTGLIAKTDSAKNNSEINTKAKSGKISGSILIAANHKKKSSKKSNFKNSGFKTEINKNAIAIQTNKEDKFNLNSNSKNKGRSSVSENNQAKISGSEISINAGKENKNESKKSESQQETTKNPGNILVQKDTDLAIKTKSESPAIVTDSVKQEMVKPELAANVISEDTTSTKKKKEAKKLSFSIHATPQYTYQRVLANTEDDVMILKLNNKNEFSKERLGYEIGIRTYLPVNEKIEFETGIHFARLNQKLNFTIASKQADSAVSVVNNGNVSMNVFNRQLQEQHSFKYYFGGMYAGGNFGFGDHFKLTAGAGANWILSTNPNRKTSGIESHDFNPYLSAGILFSRPLSNSLTWQAGPTVQYYLRQTQDEKTYFGAKPTTIGFKFGIRFN